jgi:hypothetical protein
MTLSHTQSISMDHLARYCHRARDGGASNLDKVLDTNQAVQKIIIAVPRANSADEFYIQIALVLKNPLFLLARRHSHPKHIGCGPVITLIKSFPKSKESDIFRLTYVS